MFRDEILSRSSTARSLWNYISSLRERYPPGTHNNTVLEENLYRISKTMPFHGLDSFYAETYDILLSIFADNPQDPKKIARRFNELEQNISVNT